MPSRQLVAPTDAALLAVSLDDAKLHLRVDHADEDDLIELLIRAAMEDAEAMMGRALLPQTWRQRLDAWPAGSVELGPACVSAVTAIAYTDSAGAAQTLDVSTAVHLQSDALTAHLWPAYGTTWPATRAQPDAVSITYTCGTWATPAELPALVVAWIKLRIGALYLHRESWTSGKAIERNEHTDRLLDRWLVHRL